jgi:hypothetical protein
LGWFSTLSARRTIGMAVNPITFSDIDAWARLMGVSPSPWEVTLLTRLDDAWRARAPAGEAPAGEGPEAVKGLMLSLPQKTKAKKPKPKA